MAVAIPCPQCKAVMRSAAPIPAGRKVKCPKCNALFAAPANGAAASKPSASGTAGKPGVAANRPSASGMAGKPGVAANRPSASGQAARPRPSASGNGVKPVDFSSFATAAAPTPAKKPRKRSRVKLIFALLLLLGLVGGGLWAYNQITSPSASTSAESSQAAATTTAATAAPTPAMVKSSDDPFFYLPADSAQLGGLQLAALLQVPVIKANAEALLATPQLGMLAAELKRLTGLAPEEIERLVIAGTGDINADRPETIVIALRTTAAVDEQKLAKLPDVVETKKGKHRDYRTLSSSALTLTYAVRACCKPADRLIVVAMGSEEQVAAVMDNPGAAATLPAELTPLIRQTEQSQAWTILPLNDALRQQLAGMAPAAATVAPDLVEPAKSMAQARAAGLWINVNATEAKLSAGVQFPNEALAKSTADSLGGLWTKVKMPIQEMLKPTVSGLPGDMRDLVADVFSSGAVTTNGEVAQASIRLSMAPIEGLATLSKTIGVGTLFASIEQARIKGGLGAPTGPPAGGENEKALLEMINKAREDDMAPPLKTEPRLFAVAGQYARRAAKDGNFEEIKLNDINDSLREAGYQPGALLANRAISAANEKLDAEQIIKNWLEDDATKNTLLNKDVTECGIGIGKSEAGELFLLLVVAKR